MTGKPDGLDRLRFSNRFTTELPADPVTGNHSRQVSQAMFSRVLPTPVKAPQLVAMADEVAQLIGLDIEQCDPERLARVLSGNEILPGMDPYASVYGGHQFGHWAGQLGDGRAINLGEVETADHKAWTLQLKGAGATPYSRTADGRAVLRSSVREFLCSEAMHHLGVPTTRALSLVLTGDSVVRDMFYDGNPRAEQGAIVCRVAPSFVRFGHFELPASRGDTVLLENLLQFVIRHDRPDLATALVSANEAQRRETYLQWYAGVCALTRDMIVHWMRVGFVHGVMNTDNMSVLGLTIDYGPYGWIDDYDPDWTPNTTDAGQRRYRFGQQADIAHWNLYQLANALYPVVQDADALQGILDSWQTEYRLAYHRMMAAKLGLPEVALEHPDFPALLTQLDSMLRSQAVDMTIFFRRLMDFACSVDAPEGPHRESLVEYITPAIYPDGNDRNPAVDPENLPLYYQWETLYRQFLLAYPFKVERRRKNMAAVNPVFVLRNYLAQQAIDALEQGDGSELEALLRVLKKPYEVLSGADARFAARRPEWARERAGCSMLSCSS